MPSLSREKFVEKVLAIAADKFPLLKIARADQPFSLKVNGNVATLENLYRTAMLHADDMQHQIERWIVELLRASEGTPDREGSFADLRERVMPIILNDRPGTAVDPSTVSQPLVTGLRIGYAIDGDRTIAHIPDSQFRAWGVTLDDLHEAALENLVSRSEKMAAHAAQDEETGEVNLIIFQTMDGYDASRVLLPNLHERLRQYLGSPFVAAIPNRDILLCFRDEPETVDRLKEQIRSDHRRLPHGVTDRLLLVTPDGIAPRG